MADDSELLRFADKIGWSREYSGEVRTSEDLSTISEVKQILETDLRWDLNYTGAITYPGSAALWIGKCFSRIEAGQVLFLYERTDGEQPRYMLMKRIRNNGGPPSMPPMIMGYFKLMP